jgi:hypothetical protein
MLFYLCDLRFQALAVPVYLKHLQSPSPRHDDMATVRLDEAFEAELLAALIVFCLNNSHRLDAVHDIAVLLNN